MLRLCEKGEEKTKERMKEDSFNSGENATQQRSDKNFGKEPPMDCGRGAWMYLATIVTVEMIIWGYAGSFGIFLDFYSNKEHSDMATDPHSGTLLPLVGTVNTAMLSFMAPFFTGIVTRYPSTRRWLMISGLGIIFLSLFLSSYSKSCIHVFLTQGIGYGVGGSALYYSALSYLTEWFSARLGFANGLIFAGCGSGGLIFPLIINALLEKLGVKLALQILACIVTLLMGTCLCLIRSRVHIIAHKNVVKPEDSKKKVLVGSAKERQSCSLFKRLGRHVRWPVAIYLISNFLQAIAFYIPSLYLPSYAHSLSLKSSQTTATLVAFNASSIVARIVCGHLSDHYSPHLIGAVIGLVSGVSALLIWGGFGDRGWASLMIFASIFGCTSGSWSSLYFGITRVWLRSPQYAMALFGVISMTRGMGNLIAAPLSSALRTTTAPVEKIRTGFDVDSYSGVILLCGLCLIGTFILELILWILQIYYIERNHRFRKFLYRCR